MTPKWLRLLCCGCHAARSGGRAQTLGFHIKTDKEMVMTPAQCRAARALIRMWLDDLARGAAVPTTRRFMITRLRSA